MSVHNFPVSPEPYRAVLADPPWPMKDQGTRMSPAYRGSQRRELHYCIMSLADIMNLPIIDLVAKDSLLFLWRLASTQEEALRVVKAWGFTVKSEIVWCKIQKPDPSFLSGIDWPRPRIGGGHYVRNAHETCLVCARGRAASLIQNHSVPSWFLVPRGRHSAKPEEFYGMIERLVAGPYLELFARNKREGWDSWGDQLDA